MRKTFITTMPDRAGAFLVASEIIADAGANITRVSYNKAVDLHTLFLDVSGEPEQLARVTEALSQRGYLSSNTEYNVILLEFKISDRPGAVRPILRLINGYDFNISYISSQENGSEYQYFKMGLFVENPEDIRSFLEQVSTLCEVRILDYDKSEKTLDNTVFYLSFAGEIARKLGLNQSDTNALIADANLIMQLLDERGKSPYKTFEYIGKFADALARYHGNDFSARISSRELADGLTLYAIEPPCGGNTYLLIKNNAILAVDCGFACYRKEMLKVFHTIQPDFDRMVRSIVLTHADQDHCGLLDLFGTVYVSAESAENFLLEWRGEPNFREQNPAHAPYCRISRILSRYTPPNPKTLSVLGARTDDAPLSRIGGLDWQGLSFEAYAGNGGHVPGELVLVCREHRLIFTGDLLVNPDGFSPEQRAFNRLAPYLMTSVNLNSKKSTASRTAVEALFAEGEWLVCPGHGAWFDA